MKYNSVDVTFMDGSHLDVDSKYPITIDGLAEQLRMAGEIGWWGVITESETYLLKIQEVFTIRLYEVQE